HRELASGLTHDPQAQGRRPPLGTEPERAVVRLSRFDVETALADSGRAAPRREPYALFSALERRRDQRRLAARAEGRPVVREVLPFEALAAHLLGVEAVDDRVVDLLEKLAVEPLVDRPRDAIGVDQQDGNSGVGAESPAGGEPAGEAKGQAGDG